MSLRYSIAQRTPAMNTLFAGLACAISLAVTAGPALAQNPEMDRVEVQGRMIDAPVRYDVRAACHGIQTQLEDALQLVWLREARYGEVKVQLVMQGSEIADVSAKGISNSVAREVRRAVNRLDCGDKPLADAQIYRFSVDFIEPAAPGRSHSEGARPAIRLAYARD